MQRLQFVRAGFLRFQRGLNGLNAGVLGFVAVFPVCERFKIHKLAFVTVVKSLAHCLSPSPAVRGTLAASAFAPRYTAHLSHVGTLSRPVARSIQKKYMP